MHKLGLIMDFPYAYSNSSIHKGSLLPSSWPSHLNSLSFHVTTLVITKIYKEPLAYQGKLFTSYSMQLTLNYII